MLEFFFIILRKHSFFFAFRDFKKIGQREAGTMEKKILKINQIFGYRGGKISLGENFGGQISSLGIPTKFLRTGLRKPTKFFRREICPAKKLRRLWRHFLYFLCISLWAPKNPQIFPGHFLEKPAKFFRCEICPLRNL